MDKYIITADTILDEGNGLVHCEELYHVPFRTSAISEAKALNNAIYQMYNLMLSKNYDYPCGIGQFRNEIYSKLEFDLIKL